ncbi:MAG: SCO family protein [Armatimonadota bacterium]|jgi:cytochrome oxidase Cu insertion factor (SCO1/SenC/PrrC family)|nr:SCO family protein [Armatimonadota bacterium]
MGSRFFCNQSFIVLIALCFATSFAGSAPPKDKANKDLPREEEVLYAPVPDISLRAVKMTGQGMEGKVQVIDRRLSSWWKRRPILLTFVFAHCAGVCYPYLRSLRDATRKIGGLGDDYEVLVVSFAPEDTPEKMRFMAQTLGLSREEEKFWHFCIGEPKSVQRLMESVRFWSRQVKGTNQYDHPAMLAALRDGRVIRLLVGATVMPIRLREVVRELKGDPVLAYPLPDPKIPFRCFRYDPKSGQWRPDWGMLALLFPPAMTVLMVLSVFRPLGLLGKKRNKGG